MKTLLTCTLFLLLCAPVGAEMYEFYTYTDCVVSTGKNEKPMVGTPCKVTRTAITPDPCLAQLEAAMRAMDKFLLPPGSVVNIRVGGGYSVETWYRKHPLEKLMKAHEQWDAAKTTCWRKP